MSEGMGEFSSTDGVLLRPRVGLYRHSAAWPTVCGGARVCGH